MKVRLDRLGEALDRPTSAVRLFLLHGPDEAGAMSLADRLGRAVGVGAQRVQLEGAQLRGDPARLTDEAAAISLFGDARWIRVTAAGEESVAAVEALLATEAETSPVVLIAPGVRTTSRLVKLVEMAPSAMAYGCYVPDERQGETIATELARAAGVRLARGVARRLFAAADGDRAVMAREIEKLALYLDAAPDRPRDADDDIFNAIAAGEAEGDVDALVAAIVALEPRMVAAQLAIVRAPDASAIPWLRAATRRLISLADMRSRIDGGETVDAVTARAHFRERDATAAALRRWTGRDLSRALVQVRALEREVMRAGSAGPDVAAHGLLMLAGR